MEEGIDLERKKVRLSLRSKKDVKTAASSSDVNGHFNYEHELQRNKMNIRSAQPSFADTYTYVHTFCLEVLGQIGRAHV